MDVSFVLPGLPPSINRYWRGAKNHSGTYITAEGRQYGITVAMVIRSELNKNKLFFANFPKEWALGVAIEVFSPFFWVPAKKEEPARPSLTAGDIDNFVKILLDTSSKAIGFNDAQVMRLTVDKTDSTHEETRMRIWRAA